MNWLQKTAQAQVELKKEIHTVNNRSVYYLVGDTYSLHQRVNLGRKGLGFGYWKAKRKWWMYADQMTPVALQKMQDAGVNTSVAGTPDVSTPVTPGAPGASQIQPEAPVQAPEPVANLTDQSYEEADSKSKWYGFPIKDNIYSSNFTVSLDGQPYEMSVTVNRRFKKGRRKIPSYAFKITRASDALFLGALQMASPEKKLWGQYDESTEVAGKIPEIIQGRLDAGEKSKLYKQIIYEEALSKRDPALTQFIEQHVKYGDEKLSIEKSIRIDNPPEYAGDYPVSFSASSSRGTWYGETAVQHSLAGHPKTVYYLQLPPEVRTIEEFNQWLDAEIVSPENLPRAQEQYAKYLQSFSFLETQQQEDAGQFQEILPIIESRSMDTAFFKSQLLSRGYIRPSKRQKRTGPGMQPQEQVTMILDSKKIVDDSYNFGRLSSTPDFLYAVVAYLMHRHKAGNINFISFQIADNVRRFHKTLEQHGLKIDYKELDNYLDSLARKLLSDIFNIRPGGSAWDQFEDFYGGGSQPSESQQGGLEGFIGFAAQHGFNAEQVQSSPKKIYRELALKLHPDVNQDPQAEQMFVDLQAVWSGVPDNLKQAYTLNWLQKIG